MKEMRFKMKSAVAGLALVLASTIPCSAAVIHVPADYSTIQAAVDAAQNGDSIQIAAGVYVEQVLIVDKTLTLSGAPGAVLRAAPGMDQLLVPFGHGRVPLLGIVRSDVVVSGLTIDGDHQNDTGLGPYTGIFFLGSSGRVENCLIAGFRGAVLGIPGGANGIRVVNPVSMGTGGVNVQVLRSTFADNLNSIVLIGDGIGRSQPTFDPALLRTTFAVNDNVIIGNGPSTTASQKGIVIWTGASGEVERNIIADHAYAGTGAPYNSIAPFGYGILALDNEDFGVAPLAALQPVRYEGNVLRNNQIDMNLARADGSMIATNSFEGTAPGHRPTALGFSGENVKVVANRFDSVPLGILLLGGDPEYGTYVGITTNAKVVANQFCNVSEPIISEKLVTGTVEQANNFDACQ